MTNPTLWFVPKPRHARSAAAPSPGVVTGETYTVEGTLRSSRVMARPEPPVLTRHAVHRVGLISVVKISAAFYTMLAAATVVALLILWVLADASGLLESIQKSLRTLFDIKSVTLRPGTVALCGGGVGLVLIVVGVAANTFAALIYNLVSEFAGGVTLDTDEEA